MSMQEKRNIKLPNSWESIEVIGRGSSGTVYRAKRTIGRNTEWAAVKHISIPSSSDELDLIRTELGVADDNTINTYLHESLQDMLEEYFMLKSLQGNTNIVACHDIQQIQKSDGIGYDVYIWMELLDSLSTRLVQGKMDRAETIHMGMDICKALSLLKSKGIIHRDIKPQNIFVNDFGDYKLGDFGSARGIKGTSTIMTIKGTFSYMAPEIIQGKPANHTSDIYSLGLVMYRLLNQNRHPFIAEGDITSSRNVEDSNYRRLSGETLPMPVNADEELGRIVLKACAFEPRNRWQRPEDMYNALAELSEGTMSVPDSNLRYDPIPEPKAEPEGKQDSQQTQRSKGKTTKQSGTSANPSKTIWKKPWFIVIIAANLIACIMITVLYEAGLFAKQVMGSDISEVQVGEYIIFGTYEQDNDETNRKEDIEWLVLDTDDNKILIISRYALDCQKYNSSFTDVTWETCSLNQWLNSTFINTAFSTEEQEMISGNDTTDKVFLLSVNEANQYFESDEERKCVPTEYAKAQGVLTIEGYTLNGEATCWWWLRSPGAGRSVAADVGIDGSISTFGYDVNYYAYGIRPALWISFSTANREKQTEEIINKESDESQEETASLLTTPKLISACNTVEGVQIKWESVPGAVQYRVFRKVDGEKWKIAGDTEGTTFTDKTAKQDCKYTYTVRCLSADKNDYTSSFDATGLTLTCIASITSLSADSIKVGEYYLFGSYEQDNNEANGKEDIEWLVLDTDDNKILIISRYALDCQKYNSSFTDVTWETCSLNQWLNSTFINTAFSTEEQEMISGNDTTDKVFLLSVNEANQYFESDEERKCVPTEYAKAQGVLTIEGYTLNGEATCWWWLRSPGYYSYNAAYVTYGGSVLLRGSDVHYSSYGVRPALLINP